MWHKNNYSAILLKPLCKQINKQLSLKSCGNLIKNFIRQIKRHLILFTKKEFLTSFQQAYFLLHKNGTDKYHSPSIFLLSTTLHIDIEQNIEMKEYFNSFPHSFKEIDCIYKK